MKEKELVWLITPKKVWQNRTQAISDIDRNIMRVMVPDQYKELFQGLINEFHSLDIIMRKDFDDFEIKCLQEKLRLIFYETTLLTKADLKGYNTYGYWVDSKRIYQLEDERGNNVDERLLEEGYEAIWITRGPEDAVKYCRSVPEWEFQDFPFLPDELNGVTEVDLTGAEHINTMDDGDSGELWRRKKQLIKTNQWFVY